MPRETGACSEDAAERSAAVSDGAGLWRTCGGPGALWKPLSRHDTGQHLLTQQTKHEQIEQHRRTVTQQPDTDAQHYETPARAEDIGEQDIRIAE